MHENAGSPAQAASTLDDRERHISVPWEYVSTVTFGLLVAAIGLVLLVWPRPVVGVVKLYQGGSVLGLNAPVRRSASVHRVESIGRVVGLVLAIGGVVLALAVS